MHTKKAWEANNPYTPKPRGYAVQLSHETTEVLRHLAKNRGQPMTKTVELLIQQEAQRRSVADICLSCKSGKDQCPSCLFRPQLAATGS